MSERLYEPLDGAPEHEAPIRLRECFQVIREGWRIIGAVCLLTLLVALIHFLVTPDQFRASTVLQIEQRNAIAVSADPNPWLEAWASMKYYPTQYRLLRSRGLAERVVVNLGLVDDPEINPGRAGAAADAGTPDAEADAAEIARLARRLLAGLEVEPEKETELVQISYTARRPELAARLANGFADAFIDWGIEKRSENVGRAATFLAAQIDTLKLEIQEKERQLQQYSLDTEIVSLGPESNVTVQRLERLNQSSAAAVAERLEREAIYKELLAMPAYAVADSESGGLVRELEREQLRLERDYETRLKTYKPDWPEMVGLKAEIDEGRQHLERVTAEQAEKARGRAQAEYQTALRREQSLEREIQKVKTEAIDQNFAAVEFKNLEMEISNRRALLDDLLRRLSETGVSARLQGTRESNVRVIDRALPPAHRFRPSLRLDLALGLLTGLGLGIGLVLSLHLLDRTVKTPGELGRLLGHPVLAVIPDVAGRGQGYGYPASPRQLREDRAAAGRPVFGGRRRDQPVAIELLPELRPGLSASEAYRSLRTALMLSSADDLRVLTVSSAQAGEGKTATVVNLGVVLAQLGLRVLILDADLRKPRLHEIFGLRSGFGLVNFLVGDATANELLVDTGLANLSLCPAGPRPPNPSELLASQRMHQLVEQVRSRFDVIVIDSPPLLAVTDGFLLGALSDGVVLCFQAGKVAREDVRACRERLQFAEIRVLGAVLNRYQPLAGDPYYRRYRYQEAVPGEVEGSATDSAA